MMIATLPASQNAIMQESYRILVAMIQDYLPFTQNLT